jgi:hypothetical protein
MGMTNAGLVWTPAELVEHLATMEPPVWARAVTLHHTGSPSLDDRPAGFDPQKMRDAKAFYEARYRWTEGPHLFIDDDQCWGLTDFQTLGEHAHNIEAYSFGIEVLGNYHQDSPFTGRGLACWTTALAATRALLDWIGQPPNPATVLFHRDDPDANKQCPGVLVEKSWVLEHLRDRATPTPIRRSGHGGAYLEA